MENGADIKGVDIPIGDLVPLNERRIKFFNAKIGYRKILASIRAIGLVEPLCVYPEGGKYLILDGYLRYLACLELKLTTVPCLILPTKEGYTANRMVNYLHPDEALRMVKESLQELDEELVTRTLAFNLIRYPVHEKIVSRLHPELREAMYRHHKGLWKCAKDLTFVKPEYQVAILAEMEKARDFSPVFARSLVLRAPEDMRNPDGRPKTPWNSRTEQKKELAAKLEEAGRRYDFYSSLYRQYVADLLKLSIYVRKLITNSTIAGYLESKHPDVFTSFKEIVFEAEATPS